MSLEQRKITPMSHLSESRRGLFVVVEANIGAGKCLDPATPVLLYDGRIVPARDVVVGDMLMGPDSQPRKVRSVTTGRGPMFCIKPKRAPEWVCNDVHVLTLVDSLTDEVCDIQLDEFLKRNKTWRERQKLFSVAVDFPPVNDPEIDPYFVGLWLGDGRKNLSHGVQLSFPDSELVDYLREFVVAEDSKLSEYDYPGSTCPTWAIVSSYGSGSSRVNPFLEKMRKLFPEQATAGVGQLRIPHHYKCGSRSVRERLLAGLLDTDGYRDKSSYEIAQVSETLADDITFVARSLGLRVVRTLKRVDGLEQVYHRMSISGDMMSLPLRVERKKPVPRLQKKHPLRFGFTVEPLGKGDYAGFTLDGDGRFLLGNFQVTHNTDFSHMLRRVREEHDGPCEVLLEPVGSPRFKRLLGLYYGDPKRWGFTFQMLALSERFAQHTYAAEIAANGRHVVQDRSIFADGCFGTMVHEDGNMTDDEWTIYADTFGRMKRFLRYPDVMVYLRTEPKTCYERMKRRSRSEESGVPLAYLERLHQKHEELVEQMSRFTRVLTVDWNHFGADVEAVNARINEVATEDRKFMRDFHRL